MDYTPDAFGVDAEFPGWRVWRSDGGTWWATRRGLALSDAQFDEGMVATVCGDNADLLYTELLRQRSAADRYAEAVLAAR